MRGGGDFIRNSYILFYFLNTIPPVKELAINASHVRIQSVLVYHIGKITSSIQDIFGIKGKNSLECGKFYRSMFQ